jgi:hypothetical protein
MFSFYNTVSALSMGDLEKILRSEKFYSSVGKTRANPK